MKPPPFQYFAPSVLDDVLRMLKQYGKDAKILAGGQSLIPEMNFRKISPGVLVDINSIESLKQIEADEKWITLGAGIRQSDLARCDALNALCPIMKDVLGYVGYEQTRNRSTLGGSLAYADPAAELPAMALALDAEFEVSSSESCRWVPASAFYTGPFSTILEPFEMLTRVRVPVRPGRIYWAFAEQPVKTFGKAIAGKAVSLEFDDRGCVKYCRIVSWGVDDRPMRLYDSENALRKLTFARDSVEQAIGCMLNEIDPPNDVHASSALRSHLSEVLLRRCLANIYDEVVQG